MEMSHCLSTPVECFADGCQKIVKPTLKFGKMNKHDI